MIALMVYLFFKIIFIKKIENTWQSLLRRSKKNKFLDSLSINF